MGQKVHPIGIRLGIVKGTHLCLVRSGKDLCGLFVPDLKVREYLQDKLKNASVSRIDIILVRLKLHVSPSTLLVPVSLSVRKVKMLRNRVRT